MVSFHFKDGLRARDAICIGDNVAEEGRAALRKAVS